MARFKPTRFMAEDSKYNKKAADYAVSFIECLSHTKGTWAGKKFELLDWQEQIIRDLFGILKPNGYRQFNTAYIEIPKKNGKSELAAAVALLLTCGDGEERAEVYGCAADRQQAAIVFDVAADMVRMCPALSKRVKILTSQKRIVYIPTNSFYQVLSAEAYSKHGFNIHGVVFDELHTLSAKNDMVMTVYVDDMVFSSEHKISSHFRNSVKSIIKKYRYKLSHNKVKGYSKGYPKLVTGVVIDCNENMIVKNSLQHKIILEFEHLRKNPMDQESRQRLRGLVTSAQQIDKSIFPNIKRFAFENPSK